MDTSPAADTKVAQNLQKAAEVRKVLEENVETIRQQLPKVEDLQQKTIDLEQGTKTFSIGATNMKRHFCWRYWRFILIAVAVVLIISGAAVLLAYGV